MLCSLRQKMLFGLVVISPGFAGHMDGAQDKDKGIQTGLVKIEYTVCIL